MPISQVFVIPLPQKNDLFHIDATEVEKLQKAPAKGTQIFNNCNTLWSKTSKTTFHDGISLSLTLPLKHLDFTFLVKPNGWVSLDAAFDTSTTYLNMSKANEGGVSAEHLRRTEPLGAMCATNGTNVKATWVKSPNTILQLFKQAYKDLVGSSVKLPEK
jgi:hypothetical protein